MRASLCQRQQAIEAFDVGLQRLRYRLDVRCGLDNAFVNRPAVRHDHRFRPDLFVFKGVILAVDDGADVENALGCISISCCVSQETVMHRHPMRRFGPNQVDSGQQAIDPALGQTQFALFVPQQKQSSMTCARCTTASRSLPTTRAAPLMECAARMSGSRGAARLCGLRSCSSRPAVNSCIWLSASLRNNSSNENALKSRSSVVAHANASRQVIADQFMVEAADLLLAERQAHPLDNAPALY